MDFTVNFHFSQPSCNQLSKLWTEIQYQNHIQFFHLASPIAIWIAPIVDSFFFGTITTFFKFFFIPFLKVLDNKLSFSITPPIKAISILPFILVSFRYNLMFSSKSSAPCFKILILAASFFSAASTKHSKTLCTSKFFANTLSTIFIFWLNDVLYEN